VGKYTITHTRAHTHTHTQKTMLILNMFIYKSFYEKEELFFSKYHCCSNVWSNEDSNAFSVKLLDILIKLFCRCVGLGKKNLNEIYLCSSGQSMKQKKWSKLGTFVWDKGWHEIMLEIYSISFVNKFNFVNYIIRWKSIILHTIYELNIFKMKYYLWLANKKGLSPKLNRVLFTYLLRLTYLPRVGAR
jgi:hypothetical protein